MDSIRRFSYDLPYRALAVRVVFFLGLSLLTLHFAKDSVGIVFVGILVVISTIFVVLAEIILVRRLSYPRALELTDNVILFPHGFLWTRVTAIPCDDIIRVKDYGGTLELEAVTENGQFTIQASHFTDIEHYCTVREFIGAKNSIVLPCYAKNEKRRWVGFLPHLDLRYIELPPPLMHWTEPEDWVRYRECLARSKPIYFRLGKEVWFFVRCLGFILFPWLLLQLFQLPTSSANGFLVLSVFATLFFTMLHWLGSSHPISSTEISFRENGITQFFGKQIADWNYRHLFGWEVIEREYEGKILHILLLKGHTRVVAMALPDADVRSRVVQMLNDKHVPQALDLKLPWETI